MKNSDEKNNKDIMNILDHIVKNMITKEDVREIVKEETKHLATKSELKNMATKDDILILKHDINRLEEKIDTVDYELKKFKDETFERMDAFVDRVDTDKQETKALESQVDRHEIEIQILAKEIGVDFN